MTRADFKLVTHPEFQPAVDFITRSSEGPFIDTGVFINHRAQPGMPIVQERVYLSVATIKQLATLVGANAETTEINAEKLRAEGKLEYMMEDLGGTARSLASVLTRLADAAGVGDDALAGTPSR